MNSEPTTAVVQRYLDALAGDTPAEPIIRRCWTSPRVDCNCSAPTSCSGATHV